MATPASAALGPPPSASGMSVEPHVAVAAAATPAPVPVPPLPGVKRGLGSASRHATAAPFHYKSEGAPGPAPSHVFPKAPASITGASAPPAPTTNSTPHRMSFPPSIVSASASATPSTGAKAAAPASPPTFGAPGSGANTYAASALGPAVALRDGFTIASDDSALEWLKRTNVKPVVFGLPFVDPHLIPPNYQAAAAAAMAAAASSSASASASSAAAAPAAATSSANVAKGLRPGDVMEVVGGSGVGKTEFGYAAALQTALPQTYDGLEFGGGEASVLYIDLDFRFSLLRFVQLLHGRVALRVTEHCKQLTHQLLPRFKDPDAYLQSPEGRELARSVLSRVHVVAAESSLQLFAVLQLIPTLARHTSASSAPAAASATSAAFASASGTAPPFAAATGAAATGTGSPLALVVIDDVAAYFWQKRAMPQTTTTGAGAGAGASAASRGGMYPFYDAFVRLLRSLAHAHKLVLIATKPGVFKNSIEQTASGELKHREYLGNSWGQLVTHRIVLRATSEHNLFVGQLNAPTLTGVSKSVQFCFRTTVTGLRAAAPPVFK